MSSLVSLLLPELLLAAVACALFIVGLSTKASTRRLTALVALIALAVVFVIQALRVGYGSGGMGYDNYGGFVNGNATGTVRVGEFAQYIKLIASGVGILLVLLAWPTKADGTGNSALD